MIRVAVVDDQRLVREGFSLILDAQPDMSVVLQAEDGQQFLDAVVGGQQVDVALVDIRMPVLDGLQATRAVVTTARPPAVLVVTTFDEDAYVIDAIAAGAQGFLLKRCSGRELVEAVRAVAVGDSVLDPAVTRAVMSRIRCESSPVLSDLDAYGLTSREIDVLALIGGGLNNTEIADKLCLSLSTVKSHVTNVLAKTGSRDRVRAAILAIRTGLAQH